MLATGTIAGEWAAAYTGGMLGIMVFNMVLIVVTALLSVCWAAIRKARP